MKLSIVNFAAGPAAIPRAVLEKAKEELVDWNGTGHSVMELSHRSKSFESIISKAEEDLRSLLKIPNNYNVLFLQGGATMQFSAVYLNLKHRLDENAPVDYLVTGTWSKKAAQEAKLLGANVNIVCDSKESLGAYNAIPDQSTFKLSKNAKYVYYCDNETVDGVQFDYIPKVDPSIPLVCDMSSSILSKKIDISKFGLVFASAQKNLGPAGVTIVIVREDLLAADNIPTIMNYKIFAREGSMYNTPPTFAIYMVGLVLSHFKSVYEDIEAIQAHNRKKADALYEYIDSTGGFYTAPVVKRYRSMMNVVFRIQEEIQERKFLTAATEQGLLELKGHRSVGGLRASIYNAISLSQVERLVEFMEDFKSSNSK